MIVNNHEKGLRHSRAHTNQIQLCIYNIYQYIIAADGYTPTEGQNGYVIVKHLVHKHHVIIVAATYNPP